jgi:hypothetical protein
MTSFLAVRTLFDATTAKKDAMQTTVHRRPEHEYRARKLDARRLSLPQDRFAVSRLLVL